MISPAKTSGFKVFSACVSPSYNSLVDLINCLSLTKLPKPFLSTTLNQSPSLTAFKADITHTSGPWVTAVDNCEKLGLGFLCPV